MEEVREISIREINLALQEIIEAHFPLVRVQGEVSNLAAPSSGHIYFTLKDGAEQIAVVFFRGNHKGCPELKNGQRVKVTGAIGIYSPRGTYQLRAFKVEDAGQGDIQERLRQLKEKLEAEGLFDPSRKRELPLLPRRVGIVTSPSGAAIKDILFILKRRFPGADVIIYPSRVQGEDAACELASAVFRASFERRCEVIILTRGGGSREDLWCFNEEVLVRAVAASEIPVISAVGHEIDFVLCDLAADRRALTPSEAAEMVYPEQAALEGELRRLRAELAGRVSRLLGEGRRELAVLAAHRMITRPERLIEREQQRLDESRLRLARILGLHLDGRVRQGLVHLRQGLVHGMRKNLQDCRIEGSGLRLSRALENRLRLTRMTLTALSDRLQDLSPLARSRRGFHPVLGPDGRAIDELTPLRPGDPLRIVQFSRHVLASVTAIETRERKAEA
ncbi:MAG: exodeoxyribonuclease VII large subunit [Planctomycetes bacterium]|nr:exodeoxyribonuclease VII large subunit [Planctomycetota bacterium]